MNLIRFTFANIFDFKSVMDAIKSGPLDVSARFHASNPDNLQIVFKCNYYTSPITCFVNRICTPTNIEELHE